MAETPESNKSRAELRQKIARSREGVARDLGGLRYELDFPLKLRKTFQRHTVVWVSAAVATGLLLALLRARTKKIYIGATGRKVRSPNRTLFESGALLGLLKMGITLAQPMIVSYFAKKGAKKAARPNR